MNECIVIGGGIIGMLTALELSAAGMEVTLLERARTGRESSWAGGGILSPLYPWRYARSVTELARWSQNRYPDLAQELLDTTGIDPELTRSGMLTLDAEERRKAVDWGRQSGTEVRLVDRADVTALEPGLQAPPTEAIYMPQVAQVRSPRLVKALHVAIQQKVAVRESTEVDSVLVERGRARGVQTSAGPIPADKVVVCAGAWTRNLLASMGAPPAIEPVRGQMILFHASPGVVSHIVLHGERYAIPRRDGLILLGSTVEYTGFQKNTTEVAREQLERAAIAMFPALAGCPIEHHWAGLRPSSPDGIPYIGAYPMVEGLYLNAGHFRNGVVLAPASARLLADLVLGRPPIVPPAPYAVGGPRARNVRN
jgi:glycine oxidase